MAEVRRVPNRAMGGSTSQGDLTLSCIRSSIVKVKSYKTLLKGRWTKLLYARGAAKKPDYKTTRKQDKYS